MTQEQTGQIRIQFISKRPSAEACRKRSIASSSARLFSAANLIGLMRRSSASLAERMWLSSLETSRGLQRPRRFQRRQTLLQKLFVNAATANPPSETH